MIAVQVLCSDAAHDGKVVKVTGFMRAGDGGWKECGATSRRQKAVDQQRRDELPADLTGLRRVLKSKVTVDKPQTWEGVTADGKPTDRPMSSGEIGLRRRRRPTPGLEAGHVKYRMRCERCGLDVQATQATLWPILDTLEQERVSSITLARLGAIVS